MNEQIKTIAEKLNKSTDLILEMIDDCLKADVPQDATTKSQESIKAVLAALIKRKDIIADYAADFEKTEAFKRLNSDQDVSEYLAAFEAQAVDHRPVIAFEWLCDRMAAAPLPFMRDGAVLLILPVVNKFLTAYLETQTAEADGN